MDCPSSGSCTKPSSTGHAVQGYFQVTGNGAGGSACLCQRPVSQGCVQHGLLFLGILWRLALGEPGRSHSLGTPHSSPVMRIRGLFGPLQIMNTKFTGCTLSKRFESLLYSQGVWVQMTAISLICVILLKLLNLFSQSFPTCKLKTVYLIITIERIINVVMTAECLAQFMTILSPQ